MTRPTLSQDIAACVELAGNLTLHSSHAKRWRADSRLDLTWLCGIGTTPEAAVRKLRRELERARGK